MRIDMHLDVDQYASYSNTLQLKIRICLLLDSVKKPPAPICELSEIYVHIF